MKKIFNNKIIWVVVIAFVVVVFLMLFSKPKDNSPFDSAQGTPTPVSRNSYEGFTPGQADLKQVAEKLQEEGNQIKSENYTIKSYKSSVPVRPHTAWFDKNEKLIIFKEVPDSKKTKTEFFQKYGNPEKTFYAGIVSGSRELYVYPSIGIAVFGFPKGEMLYEIWYFEPTNINTFKGRFAQDMYDKLVTDPKDLPAGYR